MYVFKFKRGWALREEQPGDGGDSGTGTSDGGDADFNLGSAMDAIAKEMSAATESAAPAPPAGTPADQTGAPAVQAPAPAPASVEGQVSPPATPTTDAPPKTWKADVSTAHWANLAPEVKAEIHRREEDFHKGIETYKADANVGKQFQQVLQPYLPVLQQYGINPYEQVSNLMSAHYTLALGAPEQKAAFLRQIFSDYKIDLKALGLVEGDTGEPAYMDPQVEALQREITTLKSTLAQVQGGVQQTRRAEIESKIEAFAADPKNEFFNQVGDDIAKIVKANPGITLEAAYEQAIWINPATREILLQRKVEADAKARQEANKQHAAAAAKATAANVSPAPRPASATAPAGSMDDTMKETLAAIRARG